MTTVPASPATEVDLRALVDLDAYPLFDLDEAPELGPKGGPVETAWATTLATPRAGHAT